MVCPLFAVQSKTLTYTYEPFGNLTQTQDALGNATVLGYDLRGRKTGMADPDMGTWTYAYNALGQLVRQVDAKGQTSTLAYDKLGRMTNRAEADLISNWYYDTYKGGGACNKGIGKLCQAETSTGYNRTLSYDTLGRDSSTVTTLDTLYTTSATFDANGRLATQSYPSGLVAKYVYTPLGYLKEIRNNSGNALYWQANSLDAEGHLLQQTYGNNVVTQQTWNASNGRLSSIVAGAGNSVQNLSYQYDNLGNITSRSDANQSLSETFLYDSLNRLTSATVNSSGAGIVTTTFAFDAVGNIVSRSDLTPVNGYTYNPSGIGSIRPHALAQLTLSTGGKRTYQYDANGSLTTETQYDAANNIITGKGRAEYYTSFNMPNAMGSPGLSLAFYYGPEHQRIKQISSSQGTTYYLNPGNNGGLLFEKDIKPDNSTEQRNYITAYGQVVAMVKLTNSTTWTTRYLHRDNLGSLTTVTDEAGAVIERLAYEPFGKRRFANGSADPNNTILPQNTDRGFTNHEHLDELTLIHMNGRVYDPVAGRFMSADPYIQDPLNLQSYNRYAYVMNNPLGYTDPSGYFRLKKAFKFVAVAAAAWFTGGAAYSAYMGSAISAAGGAMAVTGAQFASASFTASIIGGATAGFTGGFLASGGDFNAGIKGAFGGAITGGVSGYYGSEYPVSRIVSNATANGLTAEFSGGSFSDGFRRGFAWSSLAYLNVRMNNYQQELSLKNESGANDGRGWSRGLFGNGFKVGGGRYDSENPGACSLLGCQQAGPGKVLGISYPSGGFVDMVVESFSGPHDTANMPWFYNMSTGNILRPMSAYRESFGEWLGNYSTSLVFAAPFAAAAIREQTYYPAYR